MRPPPAHRARAPASAGVAPAAPPAALSRAARNRAGSNLLINDKGQLKLADFGLARPFDEGNKPYTNRVITLWYRPPELLLGEVKYGPAIDMWSAGVLFAELLLRKPILTGRNEMQQISHIFQMFGTPTDETWPGVTQLQHYKIVVESLGNAPNKFDEHFGQLDPHAKDLLRKMLAMNPSQRISAKAALDHDYFWVEPMPLKPELMPKYPSSYEYTTKKRRHEQQKQQQAQQQQQQQQGPAPQQPHQPPHHHAQPPPHHHGQPQYGYQQQPPPQHAYPRGGPAPAYPPPAKRPAPGYEDGQYARRGAAPPNGARPQQPPPGQHASYGRPPSYGSRVRAPHVSPSPPGRR